MRLFGFMQRLLQLLLLATLPAVLILEALTAAAFETDNFNLPLNTELADLGPFLEAAHTIALQEAVAEVNTRIEKAFRIRDESARTTNLQRLHRPQALLEALMPKFGYPLFEDAQLERCLRGEWTRQTYPGKRSSHQDLRMQASFYFPLDPRWLTILSQSHTVKAFGVYFGTDKDRRPNDPAYFDNLARELSTYYGEPYGHSGHLEHLLTIGNACFPALR